MKTNEIYLSIELMNRCAGRRVKIKKEDEKKNFKNNAHIFCPDPPSVKTL